MPTFEIAYVDVMLGKMGYVAVTAPTARDAEKKFEAVTDGLAIVFIKEVDPQPK